MAGEVLRPGPGTPAAGGGLPVPAGGTPAWGFSRADSQEHSQPGNSQAGEPARSFISRHKTHGRC